MKAILAVVFLGMGLMAPVWGKGGPEREDSPPGDRPPPPNRPPGDRPPGEDRRPPDKGDFFLRMLRDCDRNEDRVISFEEFVLVERVARIPEEHQKKLFSRFDKDGDGSISRKDIPDSPEVHRRHRERDLDGDGRISFDEFSKSPRLADLPEERRREIFSRIDHNEDGFLDRSDWADRPKRDWKRDRDRGSRREGPPFAELDQDKDGTLSFEEFRVLPGVKDAGEDEQEDRFEELDSNNDGKLQPDEMPDRRAGRGARGRDDDKRDPAKPNPMKGGEDKEVGDCNPCKRDNELACHG